MALTTVSKHSVSSNTSTSISLPGTIQAGDFAVVYNVSNGSGSTPSTVTPSGWTIISNNSGLNTRATVHVKILTGSETSISLMTGAGLTYIMLWVFRGNEAIVSYTNSTPTGQMTGSTPSNQTIAASGAAAQPTLLFAGWAGSGTPTAGTSPTFDEIATNSSTSNNKSGYMIYDVGDSPSNNTISCNDTGLVNHLMGVYFVLYGGLPEQDLTPTGYANSSGYGTPRMKLYVLPTGYANTSAYGTAKLNFKIFQSSIVNTAAFGAHLVKGANALLPTGFANSSAFGSHLITHLQFLQPSGYANTSAYGAPTLGLFIQPSGFANTSGYGTPIVAFGQILLPTGFANTSAYGTPSLGFIIYPSSISSANIFGSPVLSGGPILATTSIVNSSVFGTPKLNFIIFAEGITSTNAFGSAAIGLNLVTAAIINATVFGTPTLKLYLLTSGIASTTAIGSPAIGFGLIITGFANTNAFGTAVLVSTVALSPAGFANNQAYGAARMKLYLVTTGISSGTAVGSHRIARVLHVVPSGYSNTSNFGSHTLVYDQLLVVTSIINTQEFGRPIITREITRHPVRRPPWSSMRMRS